jgi:hypothetical protein
LFFVFGWTISLSTVSTRDVPRRLRIEFEGAIFHVMARRTVRQRIVRDDADRRRLIDGLRPALQPTIAFAGLRKWE